MTERLTGTVKHWVADRGFGFAKRGGDQPDIFVHVSALPDGMDGLEIGARIQFEIGEGRNGRPCAINVRVIERGNVASAEW